MGFFQKLDHVSDDAAISAVEKRNSFPGVSSAACTTNTVDIVIYVGWEIVVND